MAVTKSKSLEKFLDLVSTKKSLFCDIELAGTKEESKLLEKFCEAKIPKNRLEEVWSHIIYFVSEKIKPQGQTDYFTKKTLNYLVDNKIALMSLCHLNLPNECLQKIYDLDNRCMEAIQTIKKRKN